MRAREKRYRDKIQAEGRRQVAMWLDGTVVGELKRLADAHDLRGMGEAVSMLVELHKAQERVLELDAPPVKEADRDRCEARNLRGGRCKNKTKLVVEVQGLEYGACSRHRENFVPYEDVN